MRPGLTPPCSQLCLLREWSKRRPRSSTWPPLSRRWPPLVSRRRRPGRTTASVTGPSLGQEDRDVRGRRPARARSRQAAGQAPEDRGCREGGHPFSAASGGHHRCSRRRPGGGGHVAGEGRDLSLRELEEEAARAKARVTDPEDRHKRCSSAGICGRGTTGRAALTSTPTARRTRSPR